VHSAERTVDQQLIRSCNMLSGEKLMAGTMFDGAKAACSTSAK
jgi:hypothetical protein